MFKPTLDCRIQLSSGKSDVHGQPIPGQYVRERCSIVKLILSNEKSSVRADSSASRGNALEVESNSVFLLPPNTRAKLDDIIELAGSRFRIMVRQPRYDAAGVLNHFEVHATMWSQT